MSNKRILIAEDEISNYQLLSAFLSKTKAIINWVKTGAEAVDYVKHNAVDIIFMDIKMPDMNGMEAMQTY